MENDVKFTFSAEFAVQESTRFSSKEQSGQRTYDISHAGNRRNG